VHFYAITLALMIALRHRNARALTTGTALQFEQESDDLTLLRLDLPATQAPRA